MGLIRATVNAARNTFGEQWRDYFRAPEMGQDVLAVRGIREGNRHEDNVITDGSKIIVAEGQCMVIIAEGKIADICSEPGEFVYDSNTEPSVFDKTFSEGLDLIFDKITEKLTYGGFAPKDSRIYYFNLKEIMDNKFGTATPIMFRILDKNIGLDIDVSIRCNGVYSYHITNPLLFYANVCGNFEGVYYREELDAQLKTEFINALQPALAKISALGVRPSEVPAHAEELISALNDALNEKWQQLRGISIVNIALNPISLSPEDAEMIKKYQKVGMLRNAEMGAANLIDAQADALRDAAKNANGAAYGFMNMNMANQAAGTNPQSLYENVVTNKKAGGFCPNCGAEVGAEDKFCSKCGKQIR